MNYKGIKDSTFVCVGCSKEIKFRYYSDKRKYCSNACQKTSESQEVYRDKIKLFEQGKLTQRRWIYKILSERNNACAICGIANWNNKPIRLWVDHIDGNASNNNPENFRLVCPNCDSQSETFGAKNYGNGRKARGLKMYE